MIKDFFLNKYFEKGQSVIELLIAIGLSAILLPALITGLYTTNNSKAQNEQRTQAQTLLKQTDEAVRAVREAGWSSFAVNGTYHPVVSGNTWSLSSGSTTTNGFTQSVSISDVQRNSSGAIVTSGGTVDPSTKQVVDTISWVLPYPSSIQNTLYFSRYLNNVAYAQTTQADFTAGILTNTQATSSGTITLANNNNAVWCAPSLSNTTITLPDGPPVAVAATASAVSTSIPNDVFVALASSDSTQVKLAYITVSANVATPSPTLKGTFTLDSTKYSNSSYVPTGIGITNSFKTNDVKYYKSSSGKLYALLATDMPDHEVIVVQINDGTGDAFQDPVNKIYKYWTFFNTKRYAGDTVSTPNQDQSPFGYGAVSISILGSRGYIDSGGYLYVFDLSNIDSKSSSNGLDQLGCRIELDGYDCQPGNGTDKKYNSGETGTSWSNLTSSSSLDCTDAGNVELYANHQLSPVQVGSNIYVYAAVGAVVNPELDIVNASTIPTSSTNPKINSTSCGTASNGSSSWKRISSLDFDTKTNTQEAANSVYAKLDGTRAYMSSNGGVDANHDGIPDSDQFYIIDTSNKSAPKFLSTSSLANGSVATSGYYNGDTTNIELFPRRALTVQDGQRAIIVGQDGYPNDGIEPQEYQVLDLTNESSPQYCGGLNYSAGFNDMTSVSEADGDNFVYMITNTDQNWLKIIQGGPDHGIYVDNGTFTSSSYNMGGPSAVNNITATVNQPTGTTIKMQVAVAPVGTDGTCNTANYSYIGPDGTANTYFTPTGNSISASVPAITSGNYQNPGQCFRYQINFATTNENQTPAVYDVTVNYSP